jgi:hypothetical protein
MEQIELQGNVIKLLSPCSALWRKDLIFQVPRSIGKGKSVQALYLVDHLWKLERMHMWWMLWQGMKWKGGAGIVCPL